LTQIGGDIGDEHPNSTELAKFLQDALMQSLAQGEFRSFALCINVATVPQNEIRKVDAIFVSFVHAKGTGLHYFVPFEIRNGIVSLKHGFFKTPLQS